MMVSRVWLNMYYVRCRFMPDVVAVWYERSPTRNPALEYDLVRVPKDRAEVLEGIYQRSGVLTHPAQMWYTRGVL